MEGFMYRFHPQTKRVNEIVQSGEIGAVREVRAHLSVNIMRNLDPNNIRYQPALGGGCLLDMGCYAVNICRMIFGREPEAVSAREKVDSKFGVDIALAGVLDFADGFGLIGCSFTADGQGAYSIVGTEGTIEVPRGILPGLGSRAAEGLIILVDQDGNRREERFAPANQYQLMVDSFAESILETRPVSLSPQDSLRNMKVLDSLARAASTNRIEAVR
jgi:predicted dehydrogenase